MKEETKKKAMVLFIVGSLFLSSIAFFVIGFATSSAPPEIEPLTSFVLEKELSRESESFYISNGFTVLKLFHHNSSLDEFANGLPDSMTTVGGQRQLIVEKIPANQTYVTIESLNGKQVVNNPDEEKITAVLCEGLMLKPSVCLFGNLSAS
ncbi:MAG: hypothetical protein HY364_04875 [Candidatus Aenigmarchaeota archaeon]|nr:hypothetical protein [Candidatus Aenigmarchaeota archaeon]